MVKVNERNPYGTDRIERRQEESRGRKANWRQSQPAEMGRVGTVAKSRVGNGCNDRTEELSLVKRS